MLGILRENDKVDEDDDRFGEVLKKKNFFGDDIQEDMNMKHYLEEIIDKEIFDVVAVKNIAAQFLEKLDQRRTLAAGIKVGKW